MDYELAAKVASVLLGSFGAFKVLHEVSIGRRSRMREEYSFAKEFLAEVNFNKHLHPYLREKGFQAIAGDVTISAVQAEYVLSLEAPSQALRDYVLGHRYLEFEGTASARLEFKKWYRNPHTRKLRVIAYSTAYMAFAFLALSPVVFSKIVFSSPGQVFAALAITLVSAAPLAWTFLDSAMRLHRAEKLVSSQQQRGHPLFPRVGKSSLPPAATKNEKRPETSSA